MKYSDHLKSLLKPLGLYNLDSGPGADELIVQGNALDQLFSQLDILEQEAFIQTAEDFGLSLYENLLPNYPKPQTLSLRRHSVSALLQISDSSFTLQSILDTAKIFGIPNMKIDESPALSLITISFPGTAGVPPGFENIQWVINTLVPCHLEVVYKLNVISWAMLQIKFIAWVYLENSAKSWNALEASV